MIVDEVALHAQGYVLGEKKVNAASEPTEYSPIGFISRRRQLRHDEDGNFADRVRCRALVNRTEVRSKEECDLGKVTIRQLRSRRKGLGRGTTHYGQGRQGITRGNYREFFPQFLLQARGEEVGSESQIPGRKAIVEAQ